MVQFGSHRPPIFKVHFRHSESESLSEGGNKETRKKYATKISWLLWEPSPSTEWVKWGASIPSHEIWTGPSKMTVGRKSVSTTRGNCGAPMTSQVFRGRPPPKVTKMWWHTSEELFSHNHTMGTAGRRQQCCAQGVIAPLLRNGLRVLKMCNIHLTHYA